MAVPIYSHPDRLQFTVSFGQEIVFIVHNLCVNGTVLQLKNVLKYWPYFAENLWRSLEFIFSSAGILVFSLDIPFFICHIFGPRVFRIFFFLFSGSNRIHFFRWLVLFHFFISSFSFGENVFRAQFLTCLCKSCTFSNTYPQSSQDGIFSDSICTLWIRAVVVPDGLNFPFGWWTAFSHVWVLGLLSWKWSNLSVLFGFIVFKMFVRMRRCLGVVSFKSISKYP